VRGLFRPQSASHPIDPPPRRTFPTAIFGRLSMAPRRPVS
jgi:hypothetical protein